MTQVVAVATPRSKAQRAILASIAISGMLVPLNSTMIAVALPNIMKEFGVNVDAAGWLVTAYLFTMATSQLVAGKLGDQLGRRMMLLGGLAYFALSSLMAALSPSLAWLVFLRIQQAIAGAVLAANGLALVFEIAPSDQRGRSVGLINAVTVLGAAVGPLLGGILVERGGWHSIFWINIPPALVALVLGWTSIPTNQGRASTARSDLVSALLLLPSRLFRGKAFFVSNGVIGLSNLAMYLTLLAIPILLSARPGWASSQTGYVLMGMSGAMALLSPIGGRLADRSGRRWPIVAGLSLLAIGLLPLAAANLMSEPGFLFVCLAVAGGGLGISTPGLQTVAIESIEPTQVGLASGIASTSRYFGSLVASSLLASLLFLGPTNSGTFNPVFVVATLSAVIAAFVSAEFLPHG